MYTKESVGLMFIEEVQDYIHDASDVGISYAGHKPAIIEAEFLDDEGAERRLGLDRFSDRRFVKAPGFGPIRRSHW